MLCYSYSVLHKRSSTSIRAMLCLSPRRVTTLHNLPIVVRRPWLIFGNIISVASSHEKLDGDRSKRCILERCAYNKTTSIERKKKKTSRKITRWRIIIEIDRVFAKLLLILVVYCNRGYILYWLNGLFIVCKWKIMKPPLHIPHT